MKSVAKLLQVSQICYQEIVTKDPNKSIWKENIAKIIKDFNKLNDLINKYRKIIKKSVNRKLKTRSSLDN